MRRAAAARCAWTAFPTKNSSLLIIISYEKASQVFEEKELDKHSAVRSCQAGGSGEGEWSRRVALHKACMGVQVHTGTRIHWDAHQTFFVRKSGGGGSPSKFFGNTDLKKLRKLRTTPNAKIHFFESFRSEPVKQVSYRPRCSTSGYCV